MNQIHVEGPQPAELSPEEADDLDDFNRMEAFLFNRPRVDPALLIPFIGELVAWSPDGTRVIAHADDHETLRKMVLEAGENPGNCVVEDITDGNEV